MKVDVVSTLWSVQEWLPQALAMCPTALSGRENSAILFIWFPLAAAVKVTDLIPSCCGPARVEVRSPLPQTPCLAWHPSKITFCPQEYQTSGGEGLSLN